MNNLPIIFQEIQISSSHIIATVSLNDPKALNALSLEMIDQLYPQLKQWEKRSDITCVLLKGEGGKAFCAGGNIRSLYESILESNHGKNAYAENFFTKEYQLDYLIHNYPKPIICLGQGFIMGGGIGLMTGASHRIVSETSILAMPEITIGLFPDVGSSWFLSRMPAGLGTFIGMTGVRMKAADALFSGLADYYIPEAYIPSFIENLHTLPWQDDDNRNKELLNQCLKKLHQIYKQDLPSSPLEENYPEIRHIMEGHTPDKVLEKLDQSRDAWLNKCAKTLKDGCPVTAWIVQEQIKRASSMSLEEIFQMELDIAIQCTRHKDFCEGIRALLIDRDYQPRWQESSLSDVTPKKLMAFFNSPWNKNEHPLRGLNPLVN